MSRATELARLPRYQVLAEWHRAYPAAEHSIVAWAGLHATKEQLVAQIIDKEEAD